MKKKILVLLIAVTMLLLFGAASVNAAGDATETITYRYNGGDWVHTREMEKLGRGLVAIRNGSRVYLSWRLLDSEDHRFGSAESNVSFNVYRNGTKITNTPVADRTNYTDTSAGTSYQVAPVVNGVEGAKCTAVSVQSTNYFDINVQKPADVSLPRLVSMKAYTGKNYNYIASKSAPSGDLSSLYKDYYPEYIVEDFHDDNTAYTTYSYTINDCSTADLDGDGEYEIIVKWDCNGQDNSFTGVTGDVLIDAYKLDGTFMWRVNLGKNIRAGAHYTQFLVYDFDGDGKAEMTCKTAPGSKDSSGDYVTAASHINEIKSISNATNETDYRDGMGYVITGDEYLTVFNGKTGKAIDTIYYPNQRIDPYLWGDRLQDGGGNRVDRFTAAVAYIDGVKPYAVYMRGYYMRQNGGNSERQAACAVSFDGTQLDCKYSFDTYDADSYAMDTSHGSGESRTTTMTKYSSYRSDGSYKGVNGYVAGNEVFVGEGNHNCAVADVDGDGKDEVMTGALCYELKDNGTLGVKWCTFLEHGDALHIGDYDPTHEGFEFFTVHEDGDGTNYKSGTSVTLNYGMSVIDPGVDCTDPTDAAYDDLIMFHEGAGGDTGRGMMGNFGIGGYYQFWSSGNELQYANGGTSFTQGSKSSVGVATNYNFRIFWDGDLYDELLDGTSRENGQGRIWARSGSSMNAVFTTSGCTTVNGTKNNPSLTADLFGDWREELVMATSDNTKLRVYTTITPSDYKIKTLMHDPVYRMGVTAEQTAYNQPPHVGMYLSDDLFGASVTGITITQKPNKTVYKPGEKLDTFGLVVTASREDGKSGPITLYRLSGFDSTKEGVQTVTVTCEGKTATFTVTVLGFNLSITNPPDKVKYNLNESLDLDGLEITAKYANGEEETIPVDDCTITGFNSTTTGKKTITVSYMGKTATFEVTVRTLTRITVNPSKTEYKQGESFDSYAMVVTAIYNDNSTGEIDPWYCDINGFDSYTAGSQTITVSYQEKTATFEITMLALTGITITSPPDKTEYKQGEDFDREGMIVTATYEDNSTAEIDQWHCNIDGFDSSTVGTQTITVSYMGAEATFTVRVRPAEITDINGKYEWESNTIPIGEYKGDFTLEYDISLSRVDDYWWGDDSIKFVNQSSNWWTETLMNTSLSRQEDMILFKIEYDEIAELPDNGGKYTFKYEFHNIAASGDEDDEINEEQETLAVSETAYVIVTVTNKNGEFFANQQKISLSEDANADTLNAMNINIEGAEISNARVYGTGSIDRVEGNTVTYSLNGIGNGTIFAASYSDGVLTNIQEIPLEKLGKKQTATLNFEPDKVFMWTWDIYPIDAAEAGYDSGDDPADNPGDDSGDDPADNPGDDSGDDPADNPGDDPGDDPTDNPGDDPEDDTKDNPGDNPEDDHTDNPGSDPIEEILVSNSFDESQGYIIYLQTYDQDPVTSVKGLTLYTGTRKGGADSSVNFAYMTGGRTGNALVLNSGKFVSADRGPRFKINTPDMTDVSELVAELYVKPVDGGGGEAVLYYSDSNTAQATTKLALTTNAWNKLTIRLKKDGGQITRTIYVNDEEKASDKASTFPVFWGTAENETYSKLYFDDLTVKSIEEQ